MPAPDQSKIVAAAMALRGTAPQLWQDYLVAAREYANAVSNEMVRAAPEMLQRAQGMALQAQEIATVLEQAPAMYEKIQSFRRAQGPQNVRSSR